MRAEVLIKKVMLTPKSDPVVTKCWNKYSGNDLELVNI